MIIIYFFLKKQSSSEDKSKNKICCNLFGLILFLSAVTILPVFENTLSDGTEVAVILKYFLARLFNCKEWSQLFQ